MHKSAAGIVYPFCRN